MSRLSLVVVFALVLGWSSQSQAGLDDYIKKDDGAFAWKFEETTKTPLGEFHRITLTSQVWQGITWKHQLRIFEPKKVTNPEAMVLFITGGSNKNLDEVRGGDTLLGFSIAEACQARVAVLAQVPNQPLLGDKSEDALIAETFIRYLETKDETWPLLFPMAKSAVKAMDASTAFMKDKHKEDVSKFVVSGGSKRGWTTWLTSAADDRVIAFAPMVIDTLNIKEQMPNQIKVWGKYSEQIQDYVSRGLVQRDQDPGIQALWGMVDPYSYRNRPQLAKPKVLIHGTNDRYWTLDASSFYFDDLKGPKNIVFLPNAGHGLDQNREFATGAVGALYRQAVKGQTLPKVEWKFISTEDQLQIKVTADPAPKFFRLWSTSSESRDFRTSKWTASPSVTGAPEITMPHPRPTTGHVATLVELTYELDGFSYQLTTQIAQAPAKAIAE